MTSPSETSVLASRFSIGLTGGIGSGKTTVANLFAARGAALIDTDLIAHRLTQPDGLAIPAIRDAFGPQFLTATGALDRARMRSHVFANPAEKSRLEAILHPLIRSETERQAREARGVYAIFVVPLLVESGSWRQRVSRVLVVDCPESLQVERVMQRSGLSEAEVRAIMAAQASRAQRLAAADDVIVNDGDPGRLENEVDRLHAQYVSLSGKSA
ncbi:dephospho-CoA kinase [Noviherbaspirillum humi]|uniref:Dephospho-CoA kinase n=1 Tax=Noviherbaspirillum humi TaxID=1688639 RepID=A0A239CQW3_9BURK|nr:dephospho-CoA kinase [Noviherbaspirillum humi]SNS22148.1 dephospho-CoA kinase [Noviherbaspirillum humi]